MTVSLVVSGMLSLAVLAAADAAAQVEQADPVATARAVVQTTMGTFEIDLYGNDAPRTVENFTGLAQEGYYDSVLFHRVALGFVIQTGDSTGTGSGGRSIWGKPFDDELDPNAPSYRRGYVRGTVAMANRGPNTNTSQWFVALKDVPSLPKAYTIFGAVRSGMEVVDAIGTVELAPRGTRDGRPRTDVVVTSVKIVEPQATGDGTKGW